MLICRCCVGSLSLSLSTQGQISDQLDHKSCVETVMIALALSPKWLMCVDAINGEDVFLAWA